MNSPEFQVIFNEYISFWKDQSVKIMAFNENDADVHRAQGAYRALTRFENMKEEVRQAAKGDKM